MTAERVVAAVDLGASAGRVVAGLLDRGPVQLDVVHRFPNGVTERDGCLHWDITRLFEAVLDGLGLLAARYPQLESIGIDSWGVDYGLLDARGELLADPVTYRDPRTASVVDDVHRLVPPDELYQVNGLQHLAFNTVYQLAAEQRGPLWPRAAHVVMIPDLVAYWLTGELRAEVTNASTTGLLDARTRTWSWPLLERLGIPVDRLPALQRPGEVRGPVLPALRRRLGLRADVVVTTVGSHDTASAVVAVPAAPDRPGAYVSSGTWSLVGVELPEPVITEATRAANFTNEAGVDGRVRFLRNVGGLWLLQECQRTWAESGRPQDLDDLLRRAAALPEAETLVDVDDPSFVAPGDMPARIAAAVVARGGRAPTTPPELTRCIVDSLAAGYATTIERAAELSSTPVAVVHVVGGGSQNALLCQRTADLTGLEVTAGPVEATALGNVLVQARARGAVAESLEAMRAEIAADPAVRTFTPAAG